MPAGQSVQAVEPAVAANLPAAHERHALASDAPTVVEYLPVAQSVQEEPATAVRYLPATQSVQDAAPAAENLPIAQSVHTVAAHAPRAAEDLPAAHAVHAVPPVVVK